MIQDTTIQHRTWYQKIRQVKPRHDESRQYKTRQDNKTRQANRKQKDHATRQGNQTMLDNIRQQKTKHDKIIQANTIQDMTS